MTSDMPNPRWLSNGRDSANDVTFAALCDRQEAIETCEDRAIFIEALRADLIAHPRSWESVSLEAYLERLAAVTESLHQGFKNNGLVLPEQPTWRIVGDILLTARIYE